MAEKIVYLSLGSNMGDREESLRTAVGRLEANDFHIRKVSSVYETAPMYVKNQSDFLNLVLEASTTLFPKRLLLLNDFVGEIPGKEEQIIGLSGEQCFHRGKV